jgi:prepilin-type processing-associated H-X9-DG protein
VVGTLPFLLCPANPTEFDPSLPCPTHYLGIAGVGEDAAELPLSDRRAGVFGYDRKVRERDIKDGLATTLAVAEALDGGPWTAGGKATLRGLSVGEAPYLGEGGQFASRHRVGFFPWSGPVVTNVLFADGSVRTLTPSVSPQVLEALATIAGGEEVGPFGE